MTRIIVVGKANTITAQIERIQRMGLVPSGPRIVVPSDDHEPVSPYGAWDDAPLTFATTAEGRR